MKKELFDYTVKETGHVIHYARVESGTCYHAETPDEVVKILEKYREQPRIRLRLYFGDTETGRDWGEEHFVWGYIDRSCGSIKVPLLVYNSRSLGGGAILDDCIVKIRTKDRVLWQHPKYHKEG